MILVDTSVVIDYVRGRDAKLLALLPTLPAAVCGVTRAELLSGARDPAHRANLATLLATFHQLPIGDTLWELVGDYLASLRRAGAFADVVIATVAMQNNIELWTRDSQFRSIQTVLAQLRLFQEPP